MLCLVSYSNDDITANGILSLYKLFHYFPVALFSIRWLFLMLEIFILHMLVKRWSYGKEIFSRYELKYLMIWDLWRLRRNNALCRYDSHGQVNIILSACTFHRTKRIYYETRNKCVFDRN